MDLYKIMLVDDEEEVRTSIIKKTGKQMALKWLETLKMAETRLKRLRT